ncbi:glycoside hydrolase family 32 protein [Paenibacillus silviterrae]|uniref:glycoside hydrolase family 32 protein n=1 Tax=Paenibacillus silviterrae TaxID=3242194 RepID=UPI00254335C5|nr:glycoside hydrolase family 32 protein [Paenibacillus chinjuensis]
MTNKIKLPGSHRARVDAANEALQELSKAIPQDGFRLHYHLMPPAGWMNDPNGLIYYQGEYHVFYQHYPYKPQHGPMYWGHAKSSDLVHWGHLPVAIAPSRDYDLGTEGGYGCWSGSAVEQDGVLTLVYTGHVDGRSPEEVQCIATSKDGVHFEKPYDNPVISGPPSEGGFGFRDPKVWKRGEDWYMVLGYGKDGLGKALLYTSKDLRSWHYMGVAAESDGTMGNMWECPDLFPLGDGDRHILVISPMNMGATKTMYLSGTMDYATGKLHYSTSERLDYGFDFYAPQTFLDHEGRRILIGWMNIWGARMPEQEEGWMGAFTLPRELKLSEDGTLRMVPVKELQSLRGERYELSRRTFASDTVTLVDGLFGDALEIVAIFDASASGAEAEFGLQVRSSPNQEEFTEIVYSAAERKLKMDRTRAGKGDGGISEADLQPMNDGRIKLHIFLDRSSIELFANDGQRTITNRIYPDPSSIGVKLVSRNGNAELLELTAWRLHSIWNNV